MPHLGSLKKNIRKQDLYKKLNAFISPLSATSSGVTEAFKYVKERGEERAASPIKSNAPIQFETVALKDNICSRWLPTTCGSRMLSDYCSPFNASVVSRLKDSVAILVGTTNLDEFGMGSDTIHSEQGLTRNAYSDNLSAGGSSGGSAVAVATQQCLVALGTDTGGSVRLPAAYNGIVGFKPSYGIVSRWGVVAYANSLDTVGVLARNVWDAFRTFATIRSHDDLDPSNLQSSQRERLKLQSKALHQRTKTHGLKLRIGVPKEYNTNELQPVVRDAWMRTLQLLQEAGHSIEAITLPNTRLALSAYYVLAPSEASSNLARYDGARYGNKVKRTNDGNGNLFAWSRGSGLGEEVRRRILLGAYSLSADAMDNYFKQAQRARRLVQQDFDAVFATPNPLHASDSSQEVDGQAQVDVIVSPTTQSLPPKLEDLSNSHSVDAYSADALTVPASLAGLPAMTIPSPIAERYRSVSSPVRSVGIQVIGQYSCDDLVFKAAMILESLYGLTSTNAGKRLTEDQITSVNSLAAFDIHISRNKKRLDVLPQS